MKWTKEDIKVFRQRRKELQARADYLLDYGNWLDRVCGKYRKIWELIDELDLRIRTHYRTDPGYRGLWTRNQEAIKNSKR